MSTKYKKDEEVPTSVIIERLRELTKSIPEGNWRDFYMSIPCQLDRDADCVLSIAAKRLASPTSQTECEKLQAENYLLKKHAITMFRCVSQFPEISGWPQYVEEFKKECGIEL